MTAHLRAAAHEEEDEREREGGGRASEHACVHDDICEVHAGGFLMLLEVSWCWCSLKGLWSPLDCFLTTPLSIHFAAQTRLFRCESCKFERSKHPFKHSALQKTCTLPSGVVIFTNPFFVSLLSEIPKARWARARAYRPPR